ncbi:polyamine aminopropyltransferase [Candidatus Bipolaricaulota bacterium]|nr:polyamine aminopropyltransferase [Candidatus Bipolaricaulota bacterium]
MSAGRRRGEDWLCEQQTAGARLCLHVERWLVRRRSPYQALELAVTRDHGRVMALDGKFMLSERDEPFYHEMLVHPAMLVHEAPERVLIVGGGDGGALREALRHRTVKEAVLVEIDQAVIDASREHLPSVHYGSFDDPRVRIVVSPGETFLPEHPDTYDVILVDSTDPIGPGKALFQAEFLAACRRALRLGGVIALQAGTPFYWPEELEHLLRELGRLFPHVGAYLGFVPLYPSGMWAYAIAGDRDWRAEEAAVHERYASRGLTTRYYTPDLHRAAFVLPRFVEELVSRALGGEG